MPKYHVIKRDKKNNSLTHCCILGARSIRTAFGAYKKLCKKEPKNYQLDAKFEYHFYPINHCRFWNIKKGKWQIDSFFGNHNQKEYQLATQKRMKAYFKQKEKQRKEELKQLLN